MPLQRDSLIVRQHIRSPCDLMQHVARVDFHDAERIGEKYFGLPPRERLRPRPGANGFLEGDVPSVEASAAPRQADGQGERDGSREMSVANPSLQSIS